MYTNANRVSPGAAGAPRPHKNSGCCCSVLVPRPFPGITASAPSQEACGQNGNQSAFHPLKSAKGTAARGILVYFSVLGQPREKVWWQSCRRLLGVYQFMLCSSDLGVLFNGTAVCTAASLFSVLEGARGVCWPAVGVQAASTLANFPLAHTVEKSSEIRFVGVRQNQVSWYLLFWAGQLLIAAHKTYGWFRSTTCWEATGRQVTATLITGARRENMVALTLCIIQGSFWVKGARRETIGVASLMCFIAKGVPASAL